LLTNFSIKFIALFIFWLLLKLWRFLRGDDFEWCVTVRSWNDLRRKLDGLTNAIHKRDYDRRPQPVMQLGALQPASQTPLVDQPPAVHNANMPRTPEERDGLGIFAAEYYAVGESSGYAGPLPADRMPQGYGQRVQEGDAYDPGQNVQWFTPPAGSHMQQAPRRRSVLENTRRT